MGKKIKKILNYDDAVVGYNFILMLAKKRREESSWCMSFNQIKDTVAYSCKEQSLPHYRDLPSDAKSFVSRCSALKNHTRGIGYITIAQQQLLLVEAEHKNLHRDVDILTNPEAKKAEDYRYCKELLARFQELRPRMLEDWYKEAERHPELAFID